MEAPKVHEEACAPLLSGSNLFHESFASPTMHKAAGLKQKLNKICMGTFVCVHIYVSTHMFLSIR